MEFSIVKWDDKYAKDYISLSLEWLEKYVEVEPRDLETVNNPYEVVLNNGGMVWFAVADNKAVGTITVIKSGKNEFELAKMAVTEKYKGNKIGNALMKTAIDYVKNANGEKMELFTNSNLIPAIHLYHKYGFVDVPVTGKAYETSDTKMELLLK